MFVPTSWYCVWASPLSWTTIGMLIPRRRLASYLFSPPSPPTAVKLYGRFATFLSPSNSVKTTWIFSSEGGCFCWASTEPNIPTTMTIIFKTFVSFLTMFLLSVRLMAMSRHRGSRCRRRTGLERLEHQGLDLDLVDAQRFEGKLLRGGVVIPRRTQRERMHRGRLAQTERRGHLPRRDDHLHDRARRCGRMRSAPGARSM